MAATLHHHQRCLDSTIIGKTRQRYHSMANIASTSPSPGRLGNDIMPWPISHQQQHHQQDSIVTSHHGQRRLSSAIASKTPQHHLQHDSAATSRYGQCHLCNATTNTTRQRHHVMTSVTSAAPLPTLARRRRYQHDSGAWCILSRTTI
jgi:hypothetical protein